MSKYVISFLSAVECQISFAWVMHCSFRSPGVEKKTTRSPNDSSTRGFIIVSLLKPLKNSPSMRPVFVLDPAQSLEQLFRGRRTLYTRPRIWHFTLQRCSLHMGREREGGGQFVWKIFLGFEGFFTLANIENSIVTYIERYIYIKHY